MSLAVSIMLFVLVGALSIYSGRYFNRYTAAVASDMGSELTKERTGLVDDSGMTAFDRELFWGVVIGSYHRTASSGTLRLGRIARSLLGATVLTLSLLIAWQNHIGLGH